MFRKNCYKCHRPSYSSAEFGEWICPVCGEDLTKQRLFDAMTLEKARTLPFNHLYSKIKEKKP